MHRHVLDNRFDAPASHRHVASAADYECLARQAQFPSSSSMSRAPRLVFQRIEQFNGSPEAPEALLHLRLEQLPCGRAQRSSRTDSLWCRWALHQPWSDTTQCLGVGSGLFGNGRASVPSSRSVELLACQSPLLNPSKLHNPPCLWQGNPFLE